MMNVSEYANDVGKKVSEILKLCQTLDIKVSNEEDMLSDDDKKDVIDNIDKYSVDDIEAKLSVICVRNKVSFDLDENKETKPTTYNLNNGEDDDESIPAWVKAALKYENAR